MTEIGNRGVQLHDRLKVQVLEAKLKYTTQAPKFCTVDLMDGTEQDELKKTAFSDDGANPGTKTPEWSRLDKKAFKYELQRLPEYFRLSCREGAGRSQVEVCAGDFEFNILKEAHTPFVRDQWVGVLDPKGKFAGRIRVKVTWEPRPPPEPEPWEGQPKLLTVTVVEGSNFRKVHALINLERKENDPFVVITAPGSDVSNRTSVITGGGAAPDWSDADETFVFEFDTMPETMNVRAMNQGDEENPEAEIIGFGAHSLEGKDRNAEWAQDIWVGLEDKHGDFAGKVRLRVGWALNSPAEKELSLFSTGLKTATMAGKLRKRAIEKAARKQVRPLHEPTHCHSMFRLTSP